MKLCSTANCTGIISTDSSAIRCLNCVRHDWKVRKQKFSGPDNKVSSPAMAASKVLGKERTKKGVTWADEETKSMCKAADSSLALPSAGLSSSTRDAAPTANSNLPDCNPSEKQPLHLRISANARLSLRSRSTSARHDNLPLAVQPTIKIQSIDANINFQSTSMSSTSPSPLVDDVNPKYLDDGNSQHILEKRPSHLLPAQSESTVASTQTGWDSDLTELSDSAGEESESELRSVSDHLVFITPSSFISNVDTRTSEKQWSHDSYPSSTWRGVYPDMCIAWMQPIIGRYLLLEILYNMSCSKSRIPTEAPKSQRSTFTLRPRT